MVIQPNMTPQQSYQYGLRQGRYSKNIGSLSRITRLYSLVPNDIRLQLLLTELNNCIGSTYNTCVEGG